MIITNKFMFSPDKISYIDIQERPVFNYELVCYSYKYLVVLHVDLNSHEINNINICEFDSKEKAKEYLLNFSKMIRDLKNNKIDNIEL